MIPLYQKLKLGSHEQGISANLNIKGRQEGKKIQIQCLPQPISLFNNVGEEQDIFLLLKTHKDE